jgi:hypothetical protein
MDLLWCSQERNFPAETVALEMGLTAEQVRRAFDDLARKQQNTEYLRQPALQVPAAETGR